MEGAREIGLREGMRGETASIEGYSRDDMGTQCSGNLLKHTKVRFILKHLNVHCKWGFLCWLSSRHVCYCDTERLLIFCVLPLYLAALMKVLIRARVF